MLPKVTSFQTPLKPTITKYEDNRTPAQREALQGNKHVSSGYTLTQTQGYACAPFLFTYSLKSHIVIERTMR